MVGGGGAVCVSPAHTPAISSLAPPLNQEPWSLGGGSSAGPTPAPSESAKVQTLAGPLHPASRAAGHI